MSKITHETRYRTLDITEDIAVLSGIITDDDLVRIGVAKTLNFYNKGGTTAVIRMVGDTAEIAPGITIMPGNDISLMADEKSGIRINDIALSFIALEGATNQLEVIIEYNIQIN